LNQQVPGVINDSESETHFFGLFDGHAGGKCSKHLAASLSSVLAEDSLFSTNLPQAIRRSFHATNEQFLKTAEKMKLHDGSTGICALLRDNKLTVANVGDCRALIICGGKALQMSVDQKPTNPDEQKRISALGGAVIYCMGVARVNRVLAVSRAFGNRTLKNVIRPDAELMEKVLTKDDDFLVMASDGLWDVLRNKDVCDICYGTQSSQNNNNRNPQMIADELVHNALFRGSMDNVTCIVVRLNEYVSRCASKVHVSIN
jgi:protein phosphatase 1L